MVPEGQVRQPQFGSMSTDLNSKFTHFNLVIHLSNVQQLALRFSAVFTEVPLLRQSLEILWELHSSQREAMRNNQKRPFFDHCSSSFGSETWPWERLQAGTRFPGVVFFLLMVVWWGETCCAPNSLELESCFMLIGARLDHGPSAGNNRTTPR